MRRPKFRVVELKVDQTLPRRLLDGDEQAVAREFAQELQQGRGRVHPAPRLVAQQMDPRGLLVGRYQQVKTPALGIDLEGQAGLIHLHDLLYAARHDGFSKLLCDGGDRPGVEGHYSSFHANSSANCSGVVVLRTRRRFNSNGRAESCWIPCWVVMPPQ